MMSEILFQFGFVVLWAWYALGFSLLAVLATPIVLLCAFFTREPYDEAVGAGYRRVSRMESQAAVLFWWFVLFPVLAVIATPVVLVISLCGEESYGDEVRDHYRWLYCEWEDLELDLIPFG
jgi:hypothetical protein